MNRGFVVKHVKGTNLYDVFQGEGWKNWTRALVKPQFVQHHSGEKLGPRLLYAILSSYMKKEVNANP
jgi:hypothetical protein